MARGTHKPLGGVGGLFKRLAREREAIRRGGQPASRIGKLVYYNVVRIHPPFRAVMNHDHISF